VKAHWLTGFKESATGVGDWLPTAEQVAETARRCGAEGVGMQARREVIDEAFVGTLRARGIGEFHVWTVDSPDDADYFIGLGAIGITTNRPGFIRDALAK
jgi:glycerophosphoryl diester phosphodiesterase